MAPLLLAALVLLVLLVIAYFGYKAWFRRWVERRRAIPARRRKAVLKDLFDLVMDAGEKTGTQPFVLYGTLLGLWREGGLICWDYDLDFGIDDRDYDRFLRGLKATLDPAVYKLRVFDLPLWKKLEVIHRDTTLNLDVFPHALDPATGLVKRPRVPRWAIRRLGHERVAEHPRDVYYPLRRAPLLGRDAFIPNKPEVLLASYYGPNYMTPDRVCDCADCQLNTGKRGTTNGDAGEGRPQPEAAEAGRGAPPAADAANADASD